jgi:probable HAF family extracellular repeat protein
MPSYSGTVHFTSTDAQAAVPANSTLTNGTGTFSATFKTLGNQTITATDTAIASVTGNSSAISVGSAAPTHFSVDAPHGANPGHAINFSVSALDAANNVAPMYSGTIHFTSTDPQASLPANSTLSNGTGSFSATLSTIGSQTITATDTANASLTGTSNSINVQTFVITSGPPPNGTVGIGYGTSNCTQPMQIGFVLTTNRSSKFESWSGSSLPPGLQIGRFTCPGIPPIPIPSIVWLLYGAPTQAGTFSNIVITATDPFSGTASATYTITINAAAAANHATETLATLDPSTSHHHYKLIDMGTLGGPNTRISGPGFQILNNRGMFAAFANTSASNPNSNCFVPFNAPDCFIEHPTVWHNNVLTDLGVLPGGTNGQTTWISATGLIAGFSENGLIDPLTGQPEGVAVLWEGGKVTDLGTVPGGTESLGVAVNSRGQVVGFSSNDISDSFSIAGFPTQTRAFLWQKGAMRDLGTLGGPDALAGCINESGQVVGFSYTDSNVNPVTQLPTGHAFLWQDGEMTDLGTLGGTLSGSFVGNILCGINNRGQVVGASNLAGDLVVHPFLWSKTEGMKDLGTLGGTFGHPDWINDAGEVVGYATTAGDLVGRAFLWRRGVMTDLGTIGTDPQSEGESINSKGQVVGVTFDNNGNDLRGFLWEDEGPIVDLNTLVSLGSSVTVLGALNINDRGEIAAGGVLANGDVRAVLLIPCDENHPNVEGCDYNPVDNSATSALEAGTTAGPNTLPPANANASIRALRYHFPGLQQQSR